MNKPNCAHCGDTGYLPDLNHCQHCALPSNDFVVPTALIESVSITASNLVTPSMDGRVLAAILNERGEQDKRWGGQEHDDQQTPHDWLAYVDKQIEKAFRDTSPMVIGSKPYKEAMRARLVKIAALAVAGIESMDRKVKA